MSCKASSLSIDYRVRDWIPGAGNSHNEDNEGAEPRDSLAAGGLSSASIRESAQDLLLLLLRVGRELSIEGCEVESRSDEAALHVGEELEALIAVVFAIPRLANASKWQVLTSDLQDDLVAREGTGVSLVLDSPHVVTVSDSVKVDYQRLLLLVVDVVNGLLQILISDDGEDGSEDLLSHAGGGLLGVEDDGWLEVEVLMRISIAHHNLSLMVAQHVTEPLVVHAVDHLARSQDVLHVLVLVAHDVLRHADELFHL